MPEDAMEKAREVLIERITPIVLGRELPGEDSRAWIERIADAAAIKADGWQPIATAPRDGSDILLFIPDFANWPDDPRVVSALWNDCGWWSDNGAAGCNTWGNPTHWRPLPAAPRVEEVGNE